MKVGINLGFFLMGSRDPNPYSYNVKVPWGGRKVFFLHFYVTPKSADFSQNLKKNAADISRPEAAKSDQRPPKLYIGGKLALMRSFWFKPRVNRRIRGRARAKNVKCSKLPTLCG